MPVWELRRFVERALAVIADERRQSDKLQEKSATPPARTIRYV